MVWLRLESFGAVVAAAAEGDDQLSHFYPPQAQRRSSSVSLSRETSVLVPCNIKHFLRVQVKVQGVWVKVRHGVCVTTADKAVERVNRLLLHCDQRPLEDLLGTEAAH